MSAQILTPKLRKIDYDGTVDYWFFCPGCHCGHRFITPRWNFDGNIQYPTFTPSLRTFYYAVEKGGKIIEPRQEITTCHLNLTNGQLLFCSDCQHDYNGMTVELPDFPEGYDLN